MILLNFLEIFHTAYDFFLIQVKTLHNHFQITPKYGNLRGEGVTRTFHAGAGEPIFAQFFFRG